MKGLTESSWRMESGTLVQSKRMKVCEYSEVSSGEKLSMKAQDTELKKKKNLQNFNRCINSV